MAKSDETDDELEDEGPLDEGPGEEDLREQESGDLATCPKCGAAVHEEAQRCPKCGQYILAREERRSKWVIYTVMVLLAIGAVAALVWLGM